MHFRCTRTRLVLTAIAAIVVIIVVVVPTAVLVPKKHNAEEPPKPDDMSSPTQQRIAAIGPNAMSIAWNTFKSQDKPCVKYGRKEDELSTEACGPASKTYPTSRTHFNVVNITDLTPATTYYYKISSSNSTVQQIVSPRIAGDDTPFNISVVVDLGVYGGDFGFTSSSGKRASHEIEVQTVLDHSTIGQLATKADDYEIVIHPGDFGYADDWQLKFQDQEKGKVAYEEILENFYNQLAPVSGAKAYMASPGNHEADCREDKASACPPGQRNFTDFMTRYGDTMPSAFDSASKNDSAKSNAEKARGLAEPPFWYSFEYGMAHIVMIDTETDIPDAPGGPGTGLNGGPFGDKSQQLDFLKADLASVDRSVTPWLIVAGHRPWYTVKRVCDPCQAAFEDLFYKYGVDIGVFGHVHNSQRFLPVYNQTADEAGLNNPKAPMYIVAGAAGNLEGLSKISSNYSTNVFADDESFAFAKLNIKDKHRMGVEFIKSSNGEVMDYSELYKEHNVSFVLQ